MPVSLGFATEVGADTVFFCIEWNDLLRGCGETGRISSLIYGLAPAAGLTAGLRGS
jgi:hypothetical protein